MYFSIVNTIPAVMVKLYSCFRRISETKNLCPLFLSVWFSGCFALFERRNRFG